MAPTAAPKVATNFFNSKKRVIYVSASGKYFITGTKGTQYGPKAAFVRNSNGNPMALNGRNIPDPIRAAIRKGMPSKLKGRVLGPRPKSNAALMKEMFKEPKGYSRRPRSNKGVSRGPRAVSNAAALKALFAEPKGYSRKPRSNKGVSRGPRAKFEPNLGLAAMKIVGQRKTRSNKGKARGPRGPRHFPRNTNLFA
jgi:hypothetical protein